MYPAVKTVKPLDGHRLLLTFDNREERIFDVTPWLTKGAFRDLVDAKMFRTVRVSFDTVEWANGSDLCPELLYEASSLTKRDEYDSTASTSAGKKRLMVAESRVAYGKRSAKKK